MCQLGGPTMECGRIFQGNLYVFSLAETFVAHLVTYHIYKFYYRTLILRQLFSEITESCVIATHMIVEHWQRKSSKFKCQSE